MSDFVKEFEINECRGNLFLNFLQCRKYVEYNKLFIRNKKVYTYTQRFKMYRKRDGRRWCLRVSIGVHRFLVTEWQQICTFKGWPFGGLLEWREKMTIFFLFLSKGDWDDIYSYRLNLNEVPCRSRSILEMNWKTIRKEGVPVLDFILGFVLRYVSKKRGQVGTLVSRKVVLD